MSKDLISVIVPCYNVDNYLLRCLKSIENQTYGFENLEVILINDASPDDSQGLLRAFRKKHPDNTVLIELKVNGGLSHARNIGLEAATGKYVMFVDSDDLLTDYAIEVLYDRAIKYNCDVVHGEHVRFSDIEDVKIHRSENERYIDLTNVDARKEKLIATMVCYVWGKLFRLDMLRKNNIFFPEGYNYEDIPYTLLWILYSESYCYVDDTVYLYYVNDKGITGESYNARNARCIASGVDWALGELKKHDDYEKLWNTYKYEIETYCLWNTFFLPMAIIEEEIDWYKKQLLKNFPDVLSSPYVSNISDVRLLERLKKLQ